MSVPPELVDWSERLSAALGLDPAQVDLDLILGLARDAAHQVMRPAAPVTTYLVGLAVGRGLPMAEALSVVNEHLPGDA